MDRCIAKIATTFICIETESRVVLPRTAVGDLAGNAEKFRMDMRFLSVVKKIF